ncbi:MAG: DUF1292 domain-containing protein [Firmicutes bacterium]|nr:DUF1292 domain-containing protein [Bacillota bacterium]
MSDEQLNFEVDTIFIPNDEGGEDEYAILDEFEFEGKKYMVLSEIEADDTLGEDEYLYEYTEDGDDIELSEIEDDEEFDKVTAYYDSLMQEEDEE